MPSQFVPTGPTVQLTPEQSRRLHSTPGLQVLGFTSSPENRDFFAARGLDLNSLQIRDSEATQPEDPRPEDFRRPRYAPLAATGEIRILTVDPGSGDEPITCRLQHHTLQQEHAYDASLSSYEALSYTWNAPIRTRHYRTRPSEPGREFTLESWLASTYSGDAYTVTDGVLPVYHPPQEGQVDERELMRPVEISIDDSPCDVTGNLASALRQLRLADSPRNLWVDAICIDQQSLQERGEQVSQMDKIYQSADVVNIWLGPTADGSEDAVILAQYMYEYKFVEGRDPLDLFRDENMDYRMNALAALEKLTILLSRPWFTRRWVVQELALARNAVVYCGAEAMSWHQLAFSVSFLESQRLELTYMRIRDLYLRADRTRYRRGYLKTIAASTLATLSDAVVRRLPSPCTHPVFERRSDLEHLLSSLHTLQCTNPLDTIYALLAVSSDSSALGLDMPDYTRPVGEVYMDVVLRIIERKHSLNILCQRWAARTSSRNPLPTWIQSYCPSATRHEGGTDLAQERDAFVGDGRDCAFRAAGDREKIGTPGQMTDYEGIGRTLMVTGVLVDIIEFVSEGAFRDIPMAWRDAALETPPQPRDAELEAHLREWNAAFHIVPAPPEPLNQHANDRHAAFADVLTAGSRAPNSYASHTHAPICAALFAESSPYRTNTNTINLFEVRADPTPATLHDPTTALPLDQPLTNTFLARTARATHNRALARTSHGRLALVEALLPPAQPGDLVAVLLGCDVPVVLRPRGKLDFATTMSHGIFEFVGEAYVQGVMHGEAMEWAERLVRGEDGRQFAGGVFLV